MSQVGSYEYNMAESAGYCCHGYPVNSCQACEDEREAYQIIRGAIPASPEQVAAARALLASWGR